MDEKTQYSTVRALDAPNVEYVQKLADGWDWPVSDQSSLEDYINLSLTDPTRFYYWVLIDGEPAGVFGFSQHKDYKAVQIGYFIHPNYRNKGHLQKIVHSSIEAFRIIGVRLIASINKKNEISFKALTKIVETAPSEHFEETRNRVAYLFELTDPINTAEGSEYSIVHSLIDDGKTFILIDKLFNRK